MALSSNAQAVLENLREQYIEQGYPPIQEWWFQMPQERADELSGAGYIELADPSNYILTQSGHAWVMTRRG